MIRRLSLSSVSRFQGSLMLALMILAFAVGRTTHAAETTAKVASKKLSIERLYSLPSLIGTAPSGFSWSKDGRFLAFLWNDEGRNFRDVWVVDSEDSELAPQRVTRFPRPSAPQPSETVGESGPFEQAVAQETVERHPGASSVVWYPGGERLLVNFEGDLWTVEKGKPAVRMATTPGVESGAAFSPDGTRLAFLREGELWTRDVREDVATGSPAWRRHTEVVVGEGARRNVEIASFAWSPASDQIAVLEADRRDMTLRGIPDYLAPESTLVMTRRAYPGEPTVRQRIGILDPDSAGIEVEWLSLDAERPEILLDFGWSPDGRRLFVDTSDLYAKDRRLFVVDVAIEDLAGGAASASRLVARDLDPMNETFYFWRAAWSSTGEDLFFLSDRHEDYHVYSVSPAGEAPPQRWTQGDWAVSELYPVPCGLLVVGNRGAAEQRHILRIEEAGGEPVQVSHRAGTHAPVVSPSGRHAAVNFSSDGTPPDLFLTSLQGPMTERRVTQSPLEEFGEYSWVTPTYVTFESHVDGTTLHGRLTVPPDFDPSRSYPAILGSVYTDSVRNQWGGRTAHPTWGLDQYLAQEGYVLLNVDIRGSWGRGRAHRRGIRLDYGGMDIEDLESGARFLHSLGYVDPSRIGIWGSSYGGLMTAMSLFRKPGLYAAGVAGAPATNVWHALPGQMAVMMRPEDQTEEYADSSPFLHAHGLRDPLMIIHGMRDRVVLFQDSVVLVQRLIQLDKQVELVALPNAGHGWDNEGLAQTRFAFRKLLDHFDRHLKHGVVASE